MKECTGQLGNSTLTVDDNPEFVFGTIIDVLSKKEETKVQMSDTHWKLTYTQSKPLFDEESKIPEEEKMYEQAVIQIQLLRHGADDLVVELKRKAGSTMIFSEEFHKLR